MRNMKRGALAAQTRAFGQDLRATLPFILIPVGAAVIAGVLAFITLYLKGQF